MQRSMKAGFFLMFVSSLPFQGCAHSALERRVDNEVAGETEIKTNSDLRAETAKLIDVAPGLTADQRSQLSALRESTRLKVDENWAQSLKLRSVLIKDLISVSYNRDEVELVKQRIRDNESKRLALTFGAVEQANTILGHQAEAHYKIVEGFWEGHGSRN